MVMVVSRVARWDWRGAWRGGSPIPPAPSECGDTCLLCQEDPEKNATWTDTPDGSIDVGEDRPCSEDVDCRNYSCGPDEEDEAFAYFEQVSTAVRLLESATPVQILTFALRNPSAVVLNWARNAVQIRGCGDTILAHLPLNERIGLELRRLAEVADER